MVHVCAVPSCMWTNEGKRVVSCGMLVVSPMVVGYILLAGWAGLHWEREDNTMVHMRYARQTY